MDSSHEIYWRISMDKISDLFKTDSVVSDSLDKKKEEISTCIDEAIGLGSVDQDVLLLMKEMLVNSKPIVSMEDYLDES